MPEHKYTNRLAKEKSPYLLQHQHNSVDWFPWGEEAFAKAKAEDKPIFLSIGYSTCHWCHVMAHESFENEEVARVLNRDYVAIKVDKEERPDIDAVHMMVCQLTTGSGGWPLTIIMTPDQAPFFAGTYYPPQARYGMPGLLDILSVIHEKWQNKRSELIAISRELTSALQEVYAGGRQPDSDQAKADLPRLKLWASDKEGPKENIQQAVYALQRSFDKNWGGFGRRPKFPMPHHLMLLLRYHHLAKDQSALDMVEKTLCQMYRGGIFDHVGFGFSRYSTDEKWLVPHFEKMLYDNALLIMAYLEAYQITGKTLYKMIAIKTIEYVLREMRDEKGGFYCAQDADSEGVEGKYYVFTPDEVREVLGEEEGRYFNEYYDISTEGNFEGRSIPNLIDNPKALQEDSTTQSLLETMRKKLYAYRLERVQLHKDDKVLTSWNGLMIAALAKAGKTLGEPVYLEAAQQAMTFIQANLMDEAGNLLIRYRQGAADGQGLLDDYAFSIWALLELYEANYEVTYLEQALELNRRLLEQFWDEKGGGFYMKSRLTDDLICRPKEMHDGAIPSGNSVQAYNLVRLAKLTGQVELENLAQQHLTFMEQQAQDSPSGYSFFWLALSMVAYTSRELVVCLPEKEMLEDIKALIHKRFLPNTIVLVKTPENQARLGKIAPFTQEYPVEPKRASFYVCENYSCLAPIYDLAELEQQLQQRS